MVEHDVSPLCERAATPVRIRRKGGIGNSRVVLMMILCSMALHESQAICCLVPRARTGTDTAP